MPNPLEKALEAVKTEAFDAFLRYGEHRSTHEAMGVLLEEWNELQAAVHRNDAAKIAHEATQLSAVALRLAEACLQQNPAFAERSGFTAKR